MADAQIGNVIGFAAVNTGAGAGNRSNLNGANTDARTGLDPDDMDTIASLRARLTAINSTSYSASRLDTMTYNDMIYAVRLNDFASTIR